MSHHPERTARNVRPVNQPPSNVFAAGRWGQASIVLPDTTGLYGKAFSDLNRNGVFDEEVDVVRVVSLANDYAIVNSTVALGDIDGDGVSDAKERNEGTDPYDADSFKMLASIIIIDADSAAGITNYVSHSLSSAIATPIAANAFATANYTYAVSAVAVEGRVYVRGFRDFNGNGNYDEGVDGLFSYDLRSFERGKTIQLTIGDSDSDTIDDSIEIVEGTSPTDHQNYCFNCELEIYDVFMTANNLYVEIYFGTNLLYGPVIQTNSTLSLNLGHLVTTNGELIAISFWEDLDGNGVRDQSEPSTEQHLCAQSHNTAYSYRLNLGGFDANHDELPDWWQSAHNLQTGGYEDEDNDGMINLYEWWAGTDPRVPDGSNTVFSAASRSVDARIANYSPGVSQDVYLDYVENGNAGLFVRNNGCWAFDVDLSCASPWHCGAGGHQDCAPTNTTVTAISRRHVIYANHFAYAMSTNLIYYFRGSDGSVTTNRLVAYSGIGSDIGVGLLAEELPITVSPAKFLPDNFADYLVDGRYLPSLIIDQNEKAFVAELAPFTTYGTRSTRHSNVMSRNSLRASFAKS